MPSDVTPLVCGQCGSDLTEDIKRFQREAVASLTAQLEQERAEKDAALATVVEAASSLLAEFSPDYLDWVHGTDHGTRFAAILSNLAAAAKEYRDRIAREAVEAEWERLRVEVTDLHPLPVGFLDKEDPYAAYLHGVDRAVETVLDLLRSFPDSTPTGDEVTG